MRAVVHTPEYERRAAKIRAYYQAVSAVRENDDYDRYVCEEAIADSLRELDYEFEVEI
jgi:hypothetical protein